MKVILSRSPRKGKKFKAEIFKKDKRLKIVHFGATGYKDFTGHKDPERRKSYLRRHSGGRENWTKSGIKTAGFWSRWLLWEKDSLTAAIKNIERKFNLDIKVKV